MKISILILALGLVASSWAADAPTTTLGMQNGRAWANFNHDVKLGFIYGYLAHEDTGSCKGPQLKGVVSYGEMIRGIDDFYQEPANASIPIDQAYYIVVWKFNGETRDTIERNVEAMRQVFKDRN